MNITKRVLALLLVLCMMFGNVTPAMATGLTASDTTDTTETPVEGTTGIEDNPFDETTDTTEYGTVTFVYAGSNPAVTGATLDAWVTWGISNTSGANAKDLGVTYTTDGTALTMKVDKSLITATPVWMNMWADGTSLKWDGVSTSFAGETLYLLDDGTTTTTKPDSGEEVTYGTVNFVYTGSVESILAAGWDGWVKGNLDGVGTDGLSLANAGIGLTTNDGVMTLTVDKSKVTGDVYLEVYETTGWTKWYFTTQFDGETFYLVDGVADATTTAPSTEPTETTPAETTPAETTPAETTPAETTPAETEPEATEGEDTESSIPELGKAYKLGLVQGNLGKTLYINGETSSSYSYYLATTENVSEAVDVYVEAVDGGYRMYFYKDNVKTYIDIYLNGTHVNARLTEEPTAVFTWNETYKTFVTNVNDTDYFLGTYNTYTTVSASKYSYIASNFPLNFYEITDEEVPEETTPAETTPAETTPAETTPAETEPEVVLSESSIEDGTYVIHTGSYTFAALAESKTYGYPSANDFASFTDVDVMTITNVDGGITIQDCYGRYIYMKGTYNSFNVSTEAPAEGHIWKLMTDGTDLYLVNALMGKTLAYSTAYTSWGAYAELTDAHLSALAFEPYVAPSEEAIADGVYVISTNGKTVGALSQSKSYGYLPANDLATYSEVDAMTITNVDGGITIQDCYGRYIYMKGTYNNFNVSTTAPSDGHIWKLMNNGTELYLVNQYNSKTLSLSSTYGTWGAYASVSEGYALTVEKYIPLGDAERPEQITFTQNSEISFATTVTVPANTVYYVSFMTGRNGGDMMLTINGVEYGIVNGSMWEPAVIALTNDTDERMTFELVLTYPVGSMMNPDELNVYGQNVAVLAADNWNGYQYSWTAPADGTLTVTFENGKAGWSYEIQVIDPVTYVATGTEKHSSSDIPNVNSETVSVSYGDEVKIIVNTCGDEGEATPAGTVTFECYYAADLYTSVNPYEIDNDWIWNEDYTGATAYVTVPANTTYCVLTWMNGKMLSIDGAEAFELVDPEYDGIIVELVNDTEEEKVMELALSMIPMPLGSWDNPAELVLDQDIAVELEAENSGYYFTYTATDLCTLTVSVSGDTWQYSVGKKNTSVYNDQHTSGDEEIVNTEIITLSKGDVAEIFVSTYAAPVINQWGLPEPSPAPAGTVTVHASVEVIEGSEANPLAIEFMYDYATGVSSAVVTIPAYTTYNVKFTTGMGWNVSEKLLTINGEEYGVVKGDYYNPAVVALTNDHWMAQEFTLVLSDLLGSSANPDVLVPGEVYTAAVSAGSQGYYYNWAATVDGYLKFTMNTETGWQYTVYNMTTYAQESFDSDSATPVCYMPINKGDQIQVMVNTYDPENPWSAPEGTVEFTTAVVSTYTAALTSGKSSTLKFIDLTTGKTVANNKVTWSMFMYELDENGNFVFDDNWKKVTKEVPATVATINAKGVVTAPKGQTEATNIVVKGVYGEVENIYNIRVLPAATSIEISYNHIVDGEQVTDVADAKTVIEYDLAKDDITLNALINPANAQQGVTWKSSNTKVLTTEINENGECVLVPVVNSAKQTVGSGTVTITATANDGSGVKATVKVKVFTSAKEIYVSAKNGQTVLASGKSLNMVADVPYATNKKVTWSVEVPGAPEGVTVATIKANGQLTAAKGLEIAYTAIVTATAADGSGVVGTAEIQIVPAASKVIITDAEGNDIPATYDVNNGTQVAVYAQALSMTKEGAVLHASEEVTWKTSNKKVAEVAYFEGGMNWDTWEYMEAGYYIFYTGTPGKVTLTATATDGSNVSGKVTINVVKSPVAVELSKSSAVLAAGRTLALKATVLEANATNKKLTWTVTGGEKIGAKVNNGNVSVNAKLFADHYKETGEYVTLTVTATAQMADIYGNYASATCTVEIRPATTKVDILRNTNQTVTNKKLVMDNDATVVLSAYPTPDSDINYVWKCSNTKLATLTENLDGSYTVKANGDVTGTVTITAIAQDGTTKAGKVTIQIVRKVDSLTIADGIGVANTRSINLNKSLTINPAKPSNKNVEWTWADPASKTWAEKNKVTLNAAGTLNTANLTTLEEPKTLCVKVTAKDGFGAYDTATVTIYPKTTKVALVDEFGATVGKTETVSASFGGLTLKAVGTPEGKVMDQYKWTSSNAKIATVDQNGNVVFTGKIGSVVIKATALDGSNLSAQVTFKVVKAIAAE